MFKRDSMRWLHAHRKLVDWRSFSQISPVLFKSKNYERIYVSYHFRVAETGSHERRAYHCKDGWRLAHRCVCCHLDIERYFLLTTLLAM
jgi:hypothetical protein